MIDLNWCLAHSQSPKATCKAPRCEVFSVFYWQGTVVLGIIILQASNCYRYNVVAEHKVVIEPTNNIKRSLQ